MLLGSSSLGMRTWTTRLLTRLSSSGKQHILEPSQRACLVNDGEHPVNVLWVSNHLGTLRTSNMVSRRPPRSTMSAHMLHLQLRIRQTSGQAAGSMQGREEAQPMEGSPHCRVLEAI